MINIFSIHRRTQRLLLIASLLLQTKSICCDVCEIYDEELTVISSTRCYCNRKVTYGNYGDLMWDPLQGGYIQEREVTDVKVKCFNFKEPYITLSSSTCPETNCSEIEFISSNISTVPMNFFKQTPHLDIIYLNDSEIRTLQIGAFTGLSNLKTLQLERNKMKNIKSGCFHTLSTLETLDLHGNLIETIDKEALLGLISLEELDLSRNELTSLPKELFKPLENLKLLILSSNHLKSIDFDLDGLNKLRSLYVNHNKITTVETCFKQIFVDSLFLQDNEIKKMNKSCFSNTLSTLNIANNQIDNLNLLQGARSLISLNISRNRISKIEIDTFQNSAFLQKLDLSHNEISKLKIGSFSKLDSLQYLNLSSTKLEDLDSHILVPLRSLTILDVSDNDINHWDSEIFNHFSNFQKFFLQGNNLTCDVVSSLFLQSKQKNFSLIYDTDYSIENIKGLPCISGVQQQQNSAENETKPNDMTKLSQDDLRDLSKNLSSLLETNYNEKLGKSMKDLEEKILTKIDTSLKSELEEDKDVIKSELFNLENSVHDFLYSRRTQNTTQVTPKYSNITWEQGSLMNISSSNQHLEKDMDSYFRELKVLVMIPSCLLFTYAVIKVILWCRSSKKRKTSFDLGQELPIMSN